MGHEPGGADGPTRTNQGSGTVRVSRERERLTKWGDSKMVSPEDEGDMQTKSSCYERKMSIYIFL